MGKIVGQRITKFDQSIQIYENTFVHVTRVFVDNLHSTKGWRRVHTQKQITQVEKPINFQMKITKQYVAHK